MDEPNDIKITTDFNQVLTELSITKNGTNLRHHRVIIPQSLQHRFILF